MAQQLGKIGKSLLRASAAPPKTLQAREFINFFVEKKNRETSLDKWWDSATTQALGRVFAILFGPVESRRRRTQ